MINNFGYNPTDATVAFEMDGFYIWDCSTIKVGDKYYMFSSRWRKELGFGWNWLFNSEIVQSLASRPEGPYKFLRVVLPRRGRQYFDGMNTHNTCIKEYCGKFYLYYMGTTYGGNIPEKAEDISGERGVETWNRKRIGIAVADSIEGEFVRRDEPLLLPRDCSHWDCTATTNPSVAIMPDGKTYMIYKSRSGVGMPLQLGIASADKPDGIFTRLSDEPILQFENKNFHIEDPFLWYDGTKKKFCLIAKDDCQNVSGGITGEWGAGFYAESEDCIHFELAEKPKVYSRTVKWSDGSETVQCNLERPSILFDENSVPQYLYCATGGGTRPYDFSERTYIVGQKLTAKK